MTRGGCIKCGSSDLEHWGDGEYSARCYHCNDIEIDRSNKMREWREYHDEPIPKSELES